MNNIFPAITDVLIPASSHLYVMLTFSQYKQWVINLFLAEWNEWKNGLTHHVCFALRDRQQRAGSRLLIAYECVVCMFMGILLNFLETRELRAPVWLSVKLPVSVCSLNYSLQQWRSPPHSFTNFASKCLQATFKNSIQSNLQFTRHNGCYLASDSSCIMSSDALEELSEEVAEVKWVCQDHQIYPVALWGL